MLLVALVLHDLWTAESHITSIRHVYKVDMKGCHPSIDPSSGNKRYNDIHIISTRTLKRGLDQCLDGL